MKKKLALILALMLLTTNLGCGADGGEASVQSVGMICGIGSTGLVDRFAGMVSPQGETKIQKSDTSEVSEIKVAVGDDVTEGQVLFTYDTAQLTLELEKANLELEQLKSGLEDKQAEKKEWENSKSDVSSEDLTHILLEIREIDVDIRQAEFDIALKNKDIVKLQDTLKNTSVSAPCTGRIRSINEQGGYDDMGEPLPFMTIVQTDGYRVKGYVNEANAAALAEGTAVVIRSRVNDDTWLGTVSMIEWDNPQQNQNYYGESDTAMSSRYPFYVELSDSTGLLLGQHVYIEPDYGQTEETPAALCLPSYYIVDADSSPYVWAQGKNEKLEKRSLTLGAYDETMDTYEVLDGLTAEDYVAFPDDTLKPGMTCITYDEGTFTPDEGGYFDEGQSLDGSERLDGSEYLDEGELLDGSESLDGGKLLDEGVVDHDVKPVEGLSAEDGTVEANGFDGEATAGVALPQEATVVSIA